MIISGCQFYKKKTGRSTQHHLNCLERKKETKKQRNKERKERKKKEIKKKEREK